MIVRKYEIKGGEVYEEKNSTINGIRYVRDA